MLEATSMSVEAELGVDFAQIYRESALFEWVESQKLFNLMLEVLNDSISS